MMPILALVGQANSGKSTIANIICENSNASQIGFADPCKRFAQEIFKIPDEYMWGSSKSREEVINLDCSNAFSCLKLYNFQESIMRRIVREKSGEMLKFIESIKGRASTRQILKWMGTDLGRSLDKDVWTNYALQNCFSLLCGGYRYEAKTGLIPDPKQKPYHLIVISDCRFHSEIIKLNQLNCFCWRIVGPPKDKQDDHQSEREINEMTPLYFTRIIYNFINSEEFMPKDLLLKEILHSSPISLCRYDKSQ